MQQEEFLARVDIEPAMLDTWLEAKWLVPPREGPRLEFSEIDLARVRLILDLQELGANDESMMIILDLVDQVHGLRRTLRSVLGRTIVNS